MKHILFRALGPVLLGLLLTTVACKKDGDNPTPNSGGNANPAFVGPRWQMTAFRLNPSVDFDGDGKIDSDLLGFMPACDRDNSLVFDPNGKVIMSEGAVRCDKDPADGGTPDAWTYNAATRTITITENDHPGSVSTWAVRDVSAKTLTIETTVVEDGQTLKATINWQAI